MPRAHLALTIAPMKQYFQDLCFKEETVSAQSGWQLALWLWNAPAGHPVVSYSDGFLIA